MTGPNFTHDLPLALFKAAVLESWAIVSDRRAGLAVRQAVSNRVPELDDRDPKPSAYPVFKLDSNGPTDFVKRLIDIVGAIIGLVVGLPLLAIAAISVCVDTSGPAVFKQSRVGRFGRSFTLFKFRSMYVDARVRYPERYRYRYSAEEVADLKFHPECDPRLTRVGRVLRRTSVDEMPNLWNVLKGEMSLVGPRPEIFEMLPYYGAAADIILSVKPGLTSLAKVSGRDQLTFSETLKYDVEYVLTRSLLLDAQILCRTATTLLKDGWVSH